jgi:DNA-binding beta-propeller fold protein YncE
MTGRVRYLPSLLMAVLLLTGCSGEDISPVTPDYPPSRIMADVVVVDDDPAIRLHDISDDTLVLERLGGMTVPQGALLVGSEMGGYIRRARVVEVDGNLLKIKAEPRVLVDAVVSGYDDRRFTIGPGSAALMETAAPTAGASISLDGIILFKGEEEGSPVVSIERGSIVFSPAVDIGIAVNGRMVTRFGISVEGELGIDIAIRAELPAAVSHSGVIKVASLSQPANMKLGNVPIPVTLELDIFLDSVIEGSTTEPCTAEYTGSHMINAGIDYSGLWEETGGAPGMAFELPGMAIGPLSDCSIRIAVRTELRVSFYSADLAIIGIEPWIGARCAILQYPVWKWSLTGGLSITKRFTPEMLDRRIPCFEAQALADSIVLDSGPYEAADHIFVREWGGPGTDRSEFDQPRGIVIGQRGNLYVTDQNNHRVVVFDELGEYIDEWGSYGSSAGMFIFPAGIAVASDGSVLVSDSGNHRVQRFTAEGAFLGEWGDEGTGEGQFIQLEGIAAGPDSLLAVCDSGMSSFSLYTVTGSFVGRFPSVLARGAAFDAASDIYTAGCRSDGVTRTDRTGQLIATLGPDLCVTDLAVDSAGNIYLLDYDLDRLEILDPAGNVISSIGSSGNEPGEFDRPGGVAVSPEGWVYIADTANNRIQVFAPK